MLGYMAMTDFRPQAWTMGYWLILFKHVLKCATALYSAERNVKEE